MSSFGWGLGVRGEVDVQGNPVINYCDESVAYTNRLGF